MCNMEMSKLTVKKRREIGAKLINELACLIKQLALNSALLLRGLYFGFSWVPNA